MKVPSLIPSGSRVGSGDIEEEQLCSRDGELSTHVTAIVEETELLGRQSSLERSRNLRSNTEQVKGISLRKMQGECLVPGRH